MGYILYLYLKAKYFNEENLTKKKIFLISLIWIIAEKACIFDYNFFLNKKIKDDIYKIKECRYNNTNINEDDELLKIEILKLILTHIKNFNNFYDFEELNFKKEYIKSKSQHDVYLSNLNKMFSNKILDKEKESLHLNEYKENLDSNVFKKDISLNHKSNMNINFYTNFYEIVDEMIIYILNTYEENFKVNTNHFNEFNIDERIFIKKFILDLNNENNNNFDNINNNNCIDNHNNSYKNNFRNNYYVTQTVLNDKKFICNENNFDNNSAFKTNPAKINKNLLVNYNNNNKIERPEFQENNLKQKSYKALKFDEGENDPSELKEYNPVNLSASILINDWLNNLIKTNEKKYNYKPKDDILQYLLDDEKVTFIVFYKFIARFK